MRKENMGRHKVVEWPETQLTVMMAESLFTEMKKHIIESRKTIKVWIAQAVLEKIAREQKAN